MQEVGPLGPTFSILGSGPLGPEVSGAEARIKSTRTSGLKLGLQKDEHRRGSFHSRTLSTFPKLFRNWKV